MSLLRRAKRVEWQSPVTIQHVLTGKHEVMKYMKKAKKQEQPKVDASLISCFHDFLFS